MVPFHRIKKNGRVDLWDLGPASPVAPEPPVAPDPTKLKGADLATAEFEHEAAVDNYKVALREHATQKRALFEWRREKGGPAKVELWPIDARHAMTAEPGRYVLDLPKNAKPGKAQIEADEMAARDAEAQMRVGAADPQFGQAATGAVAS